MSTETSTRRVCSGCGIEALSVGPVRIIHSEVTGREDVYGTCEACNIPEASLSAAVLSEILDLEPGDPVLEHMSVTSFADDLATTAQRPNAEPWGHLNRPALAAEVAALRRDLTLRTSDTPCWYCGVNVTSRGRWHRVNGSGGARSICGPCGEQITGHDARDRTAAILAGLRRGGTTHIPHRIADHLGMLWWGETGRDKPNRAPFGHLDIRAMRATLVGLAERRAINRLPRWYDQSRRVEW